MQRTRRSSKRKARDMGREPIKITKNSVREVENLFQRVAAGEIFFQEVIQKAKGKIPSTKLGPMFQEWCNKKRKQQRKKEIKDAIKQSQNKRD